MTRTASVLLGLAAYCLIAAHAQASPLARPDCGVLHTHFQAVDHGVLQTHLQSPDCGVLHTH